MSYRAYIDDMQIFGNNNVPSELISELKRQGCPFNEEGCVYDFEVKDINKLLESVTQAVFEGWLDPLQGGGVKLLHTERELQRYKDSPLAWYGCYMEDAWFMEPITLIKHLKRTGKVTEDYQFKYTIIEPIYFSAY